MNKLNKGKVDKSHLAPIVVLTMRLDLLVTTTIAPLSKTPGMAEINTGLTGDWSSEIEDQWMSRSLNLIILDSGHLPSHRCCTSMVI